MKNKGITLIALVITIIVLIILAGVSIDLLLGDNGLINKTKETVEVTEMAQIKEEAELVRLGLNMDYLSDIENVEELKKAIILSKLNEYFEGSTKVGNRVTTSDGKYDIIVRNNLDIFVVKSGKAYLKDGEIELDYYYDEAVTTESVKIEIYPEIGGVLSYEEYAMEILKGKNNTYKEEIFVEGFKYLTEMNPEGMNLTEEQLLELQGITEFEDMMAFFAKLGMFGEGATDIPEDIEEFNQSLTKGNLTVDELLIGMQVVKPKEYNEKYGEKLGNGKVTIECTNGETKEVNIQQISKGAEFTVTENGTYTFTATGPNGETGDVTIEINNLKYNINLSTTSKSIKIGETFNITATTNSTKDLIWTSSDETIATVEGSGDGKTIGIVTGKNVGTATITVQNEGSVVKTCIINAEFSTLYGVIEVKFVKDNTYTTSETANAPKVDETNGMKLVKFDTATSSWVEGTEYSYVEGTGTADNTSSKWANAKVTKDGIDSYFVWIPRYAYKITYFDTAENRDAYRADKTQTEGIIGYSDSRGIVNISGDKINGVTSTTSIDVGDYYMVHPAFTADASTGGGFGELEGLWIGKYEASRSDADVTNEGTSTTLKVVPSVKSWTGLTIAKAYTYAKEYNTNLNSHMLKNSEWGAVAYLTESKYGRNGNEIAVNQCTSYITGAGPGEGNSNIYNTKYAYDASNFETTYSYTSTQGKKASTTGNECGIYDISGGAFECVASYYNGSSFTESNGQTLYETYGSSFATNEGTSNEYSTVYTGITAKSNYIKGDATYETSSWNSDYADFFNSYEPFFYRGGNYFGSSFNDEAIRVGSFYYSSNKGSPFVQGSFRACLVVK